jgi:hypothetical protein
MAEEAESISTVFCRAEENYRKVVNYEIKPGAKGYNEFVTKTLADLEKSWHMSISLSLFSRNETKDDLSTRNIRYSILCSIEYLWFIHIWQTQEPPLGTCGYLHS